MSSCAIVTGGLRGIGKEIALRLASENYNLVLTYANNNSNEKEVLKQLSEYDVQVVILKANIENVDDCKKVVKVAKEKFDSIDVLVNNAGITNDKLTMMMTSDDFKSVIDVNLVGTFNMINAVQRKMISQKYGRIINISSVIGIIGNAGQANYAASKAGIIALSKSVARELASRNITVNCVAPGFIQTDMTSKLDEAVIENIKKQIPTKKLGEASDVANAVSFLASPQSSYITGQVINVCGGMVM